MKTFTDREIIILKEYLASVIGKPTPFANQKSIFNSDNRCQWCEEWEVIEMLKYLINGKDNYYNDPPPNRLKHLQFWSKEDIEIKVLKDIDSLESIEPIIEYFTKRRENFNEGK